MGRVDDAITILGGGVAGLAAAYASTLRGLEFRLHEASTRLGGNAVTRRLDGHLYDSGAHRLHGRIPWVVDELRALLGKELRRVSAPSRIYFRGRSVDFPFSPAGLLRGLPLSLLTRATVDLIRARLGPSPNGGSFRDFALRTYGATLAETFLLSYSQKLWGRSCDELSPAIAGRRLKPLRLRTLLREAVAGGNGTARHLEGDFYYPRRGIGRVVEALAAACPAPSLGTGERVTRILHSRTAHRRRRICSVDVNGREVGSAGEVICTLPLSLAVRLLDPPPPAAVVEHACNLRFRNLVLVVLTLGRPSVSEFASTYFPEPQFPFTRIHEPRCRSSEMSPPGQTSLVVEIPCEAADELWRHGDDSLVGRVRDSLVDLGWIAAGDVRDAVVERMSHAYPVQETGTEAARREILRWFDGIDNLTMIGRSSRFSYLHIHDLVAQAFTAVEALVDGGERR